MSRVKETTIGPDSNALLRRLAASVADDAEVRWDSIDQLRPDLQRLVEQYRVVAAIARLHRDSDATSAGSAETIKNPRMDEHTEDTVRTAGDHERWGDFDLLEKIGEGSFGVVYRAHDPKLDRIVALKLLLHRSSSDDELASRLLIEGRALARVRHPNVVTVYDTGEHDGRVGLWMEFVRGVTLEQMLRSHGPFSAGEAALIGRELCRAVSAVHRAGLVHRDVKAQNVMREEGGRLVLMDFGAGEAQSTRRTAAGHIVGTPAYLAPEVLDGAAATFGSDVYSLGVLLYHLVTGDYPVSAATLDDLRSKHARGEVVPLHEARLDLPEPFVQVVERATCPDPARRFTKASQLGADLARIQWQEATVTKGTRIRDRRQRQRSGAGQKAGRDPEMPSVAVLPFTDMSPAKDQESFCDGMAEELINALTQISGLHVAARASAFQFRGRTRDVRQIGEALNVGTILDGSVQKDGNRLRVTVNLIGTGEGYQLWSKSFDRRIEDVFAVQDEIAGAVAGTLQVKLAANATTVSAPRSRNLEAYTLYLEGRYHWNKRTEDELKKSVDCFEQAIARDPRYGEAYVGMADAYVMLGTYGALPAEHVMPRAKRALESAFEIDNALGEAFACRGCVRSVYDWSWSDAESDFKRAIDLKPGYPTAHHWYAINYLVPVGRFSEAAEHLRRALELDPLALVIRTSLGMKSYFSGEYDDARRELSRTVALDDRFGMARFFLGATYAEQHRYDESLAELDAASRLSGRSAEILAAIGYVHGIAGNLDAARDTLSELERLSAERYVSPAKLAQVHVGIGELAIALDLLEQAHEERAADIAWLAVRPVFVRLRQDERFTRLLSRMGLLR